jgi:pimeloyl-ACP methyl ester carboxylesterase
MIHLIHGIHTEGASPVQGLIPYLNAAGFQVKYPDYGYILGLETRVVNPIVVNSLDCYMQDGDILIGHSNGCAIIYELLNRQAAVYGGAILINAALNQRITLPPGCPWIDVYFNPGDTVTEAAKIGALLGVDDLIWGEMGHGGYIGTDPKINNINCGSTSGMPMVSGHSDFFTASKLLDWSQFLIKRLRSNL